MKRQIARQLRLIFHLYNIMYNINIICTISCVQYHVYNIRPLNFTNGIVIRVNCWKNPVISFIVFYSNVAEIHVDHPGVHCKSGLSCSTITCELTGIKHPKTSPQMMPGASKYPATNGSSHDPPKNGHVYHPQNGFSHRVNSSPIKILEFDSTLTKQNSISPLSSNHCIPSEESSSAGIVPDFPIFRNGQNIQTSPGDTRSKSTASHVDLSGSFLDQIKDRACNSSNHSADSSVRRPSIGSSQENASVFKHARELSESQSDDSHVRSRFFKNNGAHGGQQQNTSSSTTKDKVICQWQQCSHNISVDALSEHINSEHIHSQIRPGADEESFVCMWDGCKVYNKPSTSRTWLEKHVICHLGVKPFRCIVAQCRMRFASQYMLTRHVNGHFNGSLRSQPPRKGDCLSRQLKKRRLRNVKPAPGKRSWTDINWTFQGCSLWYQSSRWWLHCV